MKTIEQMIAVMEAAKEGKTIQSTRLGRDNWEDFENPRWDWSCFDYRVKPKLRPYANAKECAEAFREHGPLIALGDNSYKMPTSIFSTVVCIMGDKDSVNYEDLLKSYKWQDGTPCGVEEGGEK